MSQPAQLMMFTVIMCLAFNTAPVLAVGRFRRNLRASARLPEELAKLPEGEPKSPLEHVEAIDEIAADLELRQNPVAAIPGQPQVGLQVLDAEAFFKESGDHFHNCAVVHQYAEPLTVTSPLETAVFHSGSAHLSSDEDLPPLFKKAPIFDEYVEEDTISMGMNMHARLDGITGLVQVVPHGPISRWSSKDKVPIAGFLCLSKEAAPVLHTAPTPCVPTSVARDGTELGPDDGFEVFIGNTLVQFASKKEADDFCLEYAIKIASDLSIKTWDASELGERFMTPSPSVQSFLKLTGKMTSPEGWTKGTKTLLVVVMDWKQDDNSLAPYSKQEDDPIPNYEDKIFPDVAKHFKEMSYGQFGIEVTFVPWVVKYARERIRYTAQGQLPFPALYEAARVSLEGDTDEYSFAAFDLVFVIAPQVQPVGTKGVAFVGHKGAMCNGCELLSTKFKTMVIVHEIGHNLGLRHASSSTLEYGNPYDWMGNYPDSKGLHYGAGYSWSLGWLGDEFVHVLDDSDFETGDFSTAFVLAPIDTAPPQEGQLVGIRISLKGDARDLWISFRSTPGENSRGVFLVRQRKDQPDSELVDCGCHTPSQDDAHLATGWTFMDQSQKYAIKVMIVSDLAAKVLVFAVPSGQAPKIYSRDTFTDGVTKCPVTCMDTDWLLESYGCNSMQERGYCQAGAVTFMGTQYSIGEEVCPESCGNCKNILATTPQRKNSCVDKKVNINGKSCPQIADAGWCDYETTSGTKIGSSMCPRSCGRCVTPTQRANPTFEDPEAKDTMGDFASDAALGLVPPAPAPAPAPGPVAPPGIQNSLLSQSALTVKSKAVPEYEIAAAPAGVAAPAGAEAPAGSEAPSGIEDKASNKSGCADDPKWKDADGDGCDVYAKAISDGEMSIKEACEYGKGEAKSRCQKTCKACPSVQKPKKQTTTLPPLPEGCRDDPNWADPEGHTCSAYTAAVNAGNLSVEDACTYDYGAAKAYCRKLCRTCEFTRNTCADSVCVSRWKDKLGRCYQCADHSKYCTEDWFRSECPLTCKQCRPSSLAKIRQGNEELKRSSSTEVCADESCVEAYKIGEECPTCADLGDSFCSEHAFAKACPRTCNLCSKGVQKAPCMDIFEKYTCSKYKSWGWCSQDDTQRQCARTCGTCTLADEDIKDLANFTNKTWEQSGAVQLLGMRFWSFLMTLCTLPVIGW